MTYCKENILSNRVIFYCECNVICFPTWCRKTTQIHGCIISCSTYVSTTCTWKLIAWFYSENDWKLQLIWNVSWQVLACTHIHDIKYLWRKLILVTFFLVLCLRPKKLFWKKKKNCFCWGNPKPASHCHPNWSSHLSRLLPSIPGEKSTFQNWAWWIRNHRSFF